MTDKAQLPSVETSQGITLGNMFQGMMDLAKDPEVDPAKMASILDMQERMMDRQALMDFNAAMHKARAEMPRITKDGAIKNKAGQVQSRYAHYEAIDAIVRPIVESYGLTYGFNITAGQSAGQVMVSCIVSHTGGHTEVFGPMPLALDASGSKNATQGAGSSSNYGKRYTLCAAFNIVTVGADDDGNMGRPPVSGPSGMDQIIDAAQKAAAQGTAAYGSFFNGLTNMQKGFLIDEGKHAEFKEAAAQFD